MGRPIILKVALPILILALGVGGFLALWKSRPAAPALTPQEKAWVVAVEHVAPGPLAPVLSLYGRVESPHLARIVAAVEGDVLEVPVLEGQTVASGQVLVRLDERDSRLALAQREAELADIDAQIASEKQRYESDLKALEHQKALLDLAKRAVRRNQDLRASKVASESALDEARQAAERQALELNNLEYAVREHPNRLSQLEARRRRLQALRDDAMLDIERARVTSPYEGRVAQVEVAPGDRVRVGDLLLEVYDLGALEVRAQLPSRYLSAVAEVLAQGSPLTATVRADGVQARADLVRLAGQVKQGGGGVDGLFRLRSADATLPLGRTVEIGLVLPPEPDVVALPFSALYGTDRVYKVQDDRMVGVKVERLGERPAEDQRGTRALVRSPDLHSGDRVVVTQLPNALDGLKVTVMPDDAPKP